MSSSSNKPRGYATRSAHSATSTLTNATFQGLPSPFSPRDETKNDEIQPLEPGANGVAVVIPSPERKAQTGGLGGLPPPPLSPTPIGNDGNGGMDFADAKPAQPAEIIDPAEGLRKYLKMLKMGLPQVAAEHKMRQDGKDPELLIEYLENGGSIDPPTPEKATANIDISSNGEKPKSDQKPDEKQPGEKDKEDEKKWDDSDAPEHLKKYLKMLKLKIPMKVVQNKMKQNGDNEQELQDWLDRPKKEVTDKGKDNGNDKAKEPPEELKRYLKMLKLKNSNACG